MMLLITYRHKTRLHIGQLVKDTSAKLKQASEVDHHAGVSVSLHYIIGIIGWRNSVLLVMDKHLLKDLLTDKWLACVMN